MLIRFYLATVCVAYIAFGFWSLTNPAAMTESVSVTVGGPNGLFEMAGIYGGVSLGAAALAGAGALRADFQRPALWFLVAYMGGYCFARPIAWLLHGAPTTDYYSFMAFEAAVLIGASVSLVAAGRRA